MPPRPHDQADSKTSDLAEVLHRAWRRFHGFLAKKASPASNHEETSAKPKCGGTQQNDWPVLFRSVEGRKGED